MIERLINPERPYGETKHQRLSKEIAQLKRQLYSQLNPQGKDQLEQLTDAYLEQSAAIKEDAFIEGFCAAVNLARDYWEHTTANPQQLPES